MISNKIAQKTAHIINSKTQIKQLLNFNTTKKAASEIKSGVLQEVLPAIKPQPCSDIVEISAPKVLRNYQLFEKDCINLKENADFTKIVDTKNYFSYLRTQAHRNGNVENFCAEMATLTNTLTSSENIAQQKLGKIFIGELIKTQYELENYPEVIKLAKIGLELSEKENDKVHVLARLHDLKTAYSKNGNNAEYYSTTKKALDCTEYILKNYEEVSKNFQTLTRPMTPKENFLRDQAYLKSDLAIIMAHKKRNKAIEYLIEAKEIYKKLNLKKDVRFVEVQLKRIKSSLMINKLQEYDSKSMSLVLGNKVYRSDKVTLRRQRAVKLQYKKFKGTESHS